MPGGDGTGPSGQGGGRKQNFEASLEIDSRRTGNLFGAGLGGYCKCPGCGYIIPHSPAQPCNLTTCPKCGTVMRKG